MLIHHACWLYILLLNSLLSLTSADTGSEENSTSESLLETTNTYNSTGNESILLKSFATMNVQPSSNSFSSNNSDTDALLDNLTVPNFQSFEEWKKNKLNENIDKSSSTNTKKNFTILKNDNSVDRSNDNKQKNKIEDDKFSNNDVNNLSNNNLKINLNNKVQQPQHRIKTRDPSALNSNTNELESPLGDELIEISMFGLDDDQGKLYKDRFNYASFDCAATIVKTNKAAKGANAILLDNKDSYLLNECSSPNKFIIIELCEDILVDEVLIGNYEFYSSMFKNIRLSVSDRFPTTQWMVLGEFQAENIRKLQNFRIENPLIWAKFLKIEILSHYGNEFYCPISSIQVHGTTMIEQFKDENSNNLEDFNNLNQIEDNKEDKITPKFENDDELSNFFKDSDVINNQFDKLLPEFNAVLTSELKCFDLNSIDFEIDCSSRYLKLDEFLNDYKIKENENLEQCLVEDFDNNSNTNDNGNENGNENLINKSNQLINTQPSNQPKIQPQDSIYRNIVKRLSLLESNATLSLLYIEEQSKLLSDAFTNLESQQSIKFQNILLQLNSTIQSQIDIFQKLNSDVYLSFSNLFEFQQQSFDSKSKDIYKDLNNIKLSIKFYQKMIFFFIFLIFSLFGYILLTKDIYIDETYLDILQNDNNQNSRISSNFSTSPIYSPSISPSTSIKNFHKKTESQNFNNEVNVTPNNNNNFESEENDDSSIINIGIPINTEIHTSNDSTNNNSVNTESNGNNNSNNSSNNLFRPQLVIRRRGNFLNSLSQSWSPKKKNRNKSIKLNIGIQEQNPGKVNNSDIFSCNSEGIEDGDNVNNISYEYVYEDEDSNGEDVKYTEPIEDLSKRGSIEVLNKAESL